MLLELRAENTYFGKKQKLGGSDHSSCCSAYGGGCGGHVPEEVTLSRDNTFVGSSTKYCRVCSMHLCFGITCWGVFVVTIFWGLISHSTRLLVSAPPFILSMDTPPRQQRIGLCGKLVALWGGALSDATGDLSLRMDVCVLCALGCHPGGGDISHKVGNAPSAMRPYGTASCCKLRLPGICRIALVLKAESGVALWCRTCCPCC